MTAAAKPLPAHGTYARANGSPGYRQPCHCAPCTEIKRRSNKRWKINAARGITATTEAATARQHLATLRETRTWGSIVSASGVAESGLMLIANGRRTTISIRTHNRILAVQPLSKPDPSMPVSAVGPRRRLQALACVGHSMRTLATESRITKHSARDIMHGLQPTVRRDVADRIAAAYERLAFRPPVANKHTTRTRNIALANGWHGPLAWDDDSIDDPDAKPEKATPYKTAGKYRRDPDRKREIEHLWLLNESVPSIAKKVGTSEKYVEDRLAAIQREREKRAEQERAARQQALIRHSETETALAA